MSKGTKVDLTLLKKLVGELEAHLNTAEGIRTASVPDHLEYFVEMSRAVGMASGIMQEASALIGDIGVAVKNAQSQPTKDSFLEAFLTKGSGSN